MKIGSDLTPTTNKNQIYEKRLKNVTLYLSKNHIIILKFLKMKGFGSSRSDIIRKAIDQYSKALLIEKELIKQINSIIIESEQNETKKTN